MKNIVELDQAIALLKQGLLVALPTETVYGLAGRIDKDATLESLFRVKGRPFFDPLIVHVHNQSQAQTLSLFWSTVHQALASRFWPGPLTLLAEKQPYVSELVTAGQSTVALRCPNHSLFLEVLQKLDSPLAAPSANLFGKTSPTTAEHVLAEFAGQIPVLDGGPCSIGIESTILNIAHRQDGIYLNIMRPGMIGVSDIERELDRLGINVKWGHDPQPPAPGNLPFHYQPAKPLLWIQEDNLHEVQWSKAPWPIFRNPDQCYHLHWPNTDPFQIARNLYQKFRLASESNAPGIVCALKPEGPIELWTALTDRLNKASIGSYSKIKGWLTKNPGADLSATFPSDAK